MPLPIIALPIGAAALASAMGGAAAYKNKKADKRKEFEDTANADYRKNKSRASPTREELAIASRARDDGPYQDTTPEQIPQDIQNTLKDRMQEKEFGAGEAERKASMGRVFKKGGSVSSASKRADGIATKGKTRGRMV